MAYRKILILCTLVFIICLGADARAEKETEGKKISEELVTAIDFSKWNQTPFKISADNKHIAYIIRDGNQQAVMLDDKKEETFDEIYEESLTFSPDSKMLAYVARNREDQFVVVDGKSKKKYKEILKRSIAFSPDGERVAYIVKAGDKHFAVIDGKEGAEYTYVMERSISFSPSGNRVVYAVMDDEAGKAFVILDGAKLQPYDDIFIIWERGIRFVSEDEIEYMALKYPEIYFVRQKIGD